eukprot:GHVU01192875.1.p2 GENE.GHVU01192875.1~~GHVU01192875.1.p2  ORF type:complete len:114 (+),score=3.42 GHVU01192875.1:924-1265(+)
MQASNPTPYREADTEGYQLCYQLRTPPPSFYILYVSPAGSDLQDRMRGVVESSWLGYIFYLHFLFLIIAAVVSSHFTHIILTEACADACADYFVFALASRGRTAMPLALEVNV